LRALVREAIEAHIDQDVLAVTREVEVSERGVLLQIVNDMDESA
jgi:hypothetical protein